MVKFEFIREVLKRSTGHLCFNSKALSALFQINLEKESRKERERVREREREKKNKDIQKDRHT